VTSVRYGLGQGQVSFTDMATSTEERSTRMPEAQTNWFFFRGPALTRDRRMTGSAQLDLTLQLDRNHGHLTPILVDVAPDGTTKTVSRGFLNLLYRGGLSRSRAVPVNAPFRALVTFKPQDQFFRKGHRVGVLIQASNTIWAVPDDPGATYTVDLSGSSLVVPLLP
jgi:predicted acyl esterase